MKCIHMCVRVRVRVFTCVRTHTRVCVYLVDSRMAKTHFPGKGSLTSVLDGTKDVFGGGEGHLAVIQLLKSHCPSLITIHILANALGH